MTSLICLTSTATFCDDFGFLRVCFTLSDGVLGGLLAISGVSCFGTLFSTFLSSSTLSGLICSSVSSLGSSLTSS